MKMPAALRYSLLALVFGLLICSVVVLRLGASAATEVPHVELNADNIGPRAIEDLTSKSVPRDYALAWQTLEQSLDENRPGLLEGYFTGIAKQDLINRVKSQVKSGMRTRYRDRGHRLEAIFYAPAGDAMQLRDRAQLDIQVLDEDKVIYDEPVNVEYIVLMTPGADRWLVRQMQATQGEKP
jgi:hypothetical protein